MKKDLKEGLKIFVVGVIFIALICGIIYFTKINNQSSTVNSSPKETLNSNLNTSVEKIENDTEENEFDNVEINDEVEFLGLNSKFRELEKAAIYSIELNEENNIFEYDLDNDGNYNQILIDVKQDMIRYDNTLEFRDLFVVGEDYTSHTVYVVDLDKRDSYLDVIVFSKSNGTHDYFILKNIDGKLELVEGNFGYSLGVNNIEAYHLYLNNNNQILWLDEVEANVIPMFANTYYDLSNGCKEIKVDLTKIINKEFKTNEKVYFTTLENFGVHDYEALKKNHEILPKGTKFKLLAVYETAFEVELEDGRIGHIFAKYGHL